MKLLHQLISEDLDASDRNGEIATFLYSGLSSTGNEEPQIFELSLQMLNVRRVLQKVIAVYKFFLLHRAKKENPHQRHTNHKTY